MVFLWRTSLVILLLGQLLQFSARSGPGPADLAADTPVPTQPPQAAVLSPKNGQALQGNVPIEIGLAGPGYQSVEIGFAYAQNPTGSWFPLYQGNLPSDPTTVQKPLVQWDTSAISDGNYTLRVVFTRLDRSTQIVDVTGLRVRNYSAIETETPRPLPTTALPPTLDRPATQTAEAAATPSPVPTQQAPELTATAAMLAAAATPTATPTPLPPVLPLAQANPLELERVTVLGSVGRGALATLGLFALGGLYALARQGRRRDHR